MCVALLGFGSFMFALTLCNDIKNELKLINEKSKISKRFRLNLLNQFKELIFTHSNGKQSSLSGLSTQNCDEKK